MAQMGQVPSPGPETASVRPPVQSCVIPATPFRVLVLDTGTAGRRITHGPFGLAVSGRGGWHLPHLRSMPHHEL